MRKVVLFIIAISLFQSIPVVADQIAVNFSRPQNAPYLAGLPEKNIDSDEFNTLILKIRSNRDGTARLFWATSYDPQMNSPKSIWFYVKRSDHFRDYVFNLRSQNPNWGGFIPQFALLPEGGPAGLEIMNGTILPGNLTTNIQSGWQEFWGPQGREIIGSTINTIQSSDLFGRSIFIYIYWILGLFALGVLAWATNTWLALKKKPSFNEVLVRSGQNIFMGLVVFWVLLELSSLINDWRQVRHDWKYVGKNYEEKLSLANTGDFYRFIQFCESNLPTDAKFDLRIPPFYDDIKARYYLYPRQVTTVEADFFVVYDLDIEKEAAHRYRPWKTFREKAYILRRAHD